MNVNVKILSLIYFIIQFDLCLPAIVIVLFIPSFDTPSVLEILKLLANYL